jgi:hypothetical protein
MTKNYIADVNEFDQNFKDMKGKINLTENEQKDIVNQINLRMEKPSKKNGFSTWKPYMALATAFLLVIVFAAPILSDGLSLFSKNSSAVETVEKFYEAYNNKDYETHKSFWSNRSKKEYEEKVKSIDSPASPEEMMRTWKRQWVPVEVMQIKDYGGTNKRTTVMALLHYNSTLLSREATIKVTYELIKEEGEWKIDKTVSHEEI